MINAIARLAVGLMAVIGFATAYPAGATPVGGAVNHVTIWVPDYPGRRIYIDTFDYTVTPATFTKKSFGVANRSCYPNAVTVFGTDLYVVCNSDWGGLDQILVYNASTLAYERKITGLATDGNNYFTGSSLIAILFDAHNNLWVTGYNTNDLLRVPSSQLTKAAPKVDRQVIDSPDSPAGLALDTDGSIWVVGQYEGGIALNFTNGTLNAAGTYLGATALNPTPRFCISNSAGCQNTPGLFNNPEGVAVFDGSAWVSNNGGNAPAATIVRLKRSKGALQATTYGGTVNKPFACPGGMFSVASPNGTPTLWVNDEGYNVKSVGGSTDCGASGADQGNQIGRVLEFLKNDLLLHEASPKPEQFTDWQSIGAGSPGFGGIFVHMD